MKNLYKRLRNLEELFCGFLLIVIVFLVFFAALTRKIGFPMQKSLDIVQLMFGWLAFIGADIALNREKLVGVDIFTKMMKERTQIIIRLINLILIIAVLSIFVVKGFALSVDSWGRTFQSLKLSYSFLTLSLPMGSLLMIISSIELIIKNIKRLKRIKR